MTPEVKIKRLRGGLKKAIRMLKETKWAEHHCQCPVGFSVPDGPVGCAGCVCYDWMKPLKELLKNTE